MNIIDSLKFISIFFIMFGILYLLYPMIIKKREKPLPRKRKDSKGKFAILIPARDESKVITGILNSLKDQTVSIDFADVYVIVETKTDPTVEICNQYGAQIVYRKDLSKQRKGYALDDAIQKIIETKKQYDAYFIFDADNVLDNNYFEEMQKTYQEGYEIGIGYRNCKNGNASIFAACSSLTFSMVNTMENERRKKHGETMIISGTGFYITNNWIMKWKGYPFHSLTEDYELSLYAALHGISTNYNKKAIFYDEQPCQYQVTVMQRIRWIRGYFDCRKKYIPLIKQSLKEQKENTNSKRNECVGVKPYIMMVIGVLLWLFIYVLSGIIDQSPLRVLSEIVILLFIVYFMMCMVTMIMIHKENRLLKLSSHMKIKMIFFYPCYLITYIPCALKALLQKDVKWNKIEHTGEK